ncbi:MAG: hypothetical protein ACXWZF_09120 [Actinomycetota bacterium]
MSFSDRFAKMDEVAERAAELKTFFPEAWAFGEEAANEAFRTRSSDLVRVIHEHGQEGIEFYSQQVRETLVERVSTGELEYDGQVSERSLTAMGIACGLKLQDSLEAEARGRSRGAARGIPYEVQR